MAIDLVHATAGADATAYGFSFAAMNPQSYLALADLMYGDPDAILRFLTSRRAHKNLFAGSWQFLRWGVLEPMRASGYVVTAAKAMLAARRAKAVPVETVAIEPVAIETSAVETSAVETSVTMPIVIAPIVEIAPTAALVVAETLAPAATDIAFDFDTLAAELIEAAAPEDHLDVTADWMSALLTLAATEMKRVHMPEEQADAPAIVAA